MTKRMVSAVATRGRIIAMLLVAAVCIAIGVALSRADASPEDTVQFLSIFGLTIFVPLVSLVIASATLGTLIEEKTLIYFWLRPIGRWKIAAAAIAAGLLVLLPLILVPMGVLGAVTGESINAQGLVVASLVGLIGYTAVFTMLGLFTQRALVWGLVYILVWEGVISGFSRGAGWLAIRTYADSALMRITDSTELIDRPPSTSTIIIVIASIAVTCFGITTWRLNTMTVD